MGQTSIPCDSEVRDRLAADKPDDASWSEYLSMLHSDQEIVIDSGGTGGDVTERLRAVEEQLETLPERTAEQFERRFA